MTIGQNLLDIIGVLIGFITVMLLLSLVITALVQTTQATIRLRARNLKKGIHVLINNVLGGKTKENKKKAANLLNARNLAVMSTAKDPNKLWSKLKGSQVSYIDIKELKKAIGYAKLELKNEQIKELKSGINEMWGRLEKQLNKRFLLFIRIISIAWAIIIAFYFQVSTPKLLSELSTDPNLRTQYLAEAIDLKNEMKERLGVITDYQDISEQALSRLEKKYPELKEKLEEASGIDKDKNLLLEELEIVLEDEKTNIAAIQESYEEILDELYMEQKKKNLEQVRAVTAILGRLNINPWQDELEFYYKEGTFQWDNIIGVLITAIFLTFGAPFWFSRLQEVLKLKDALSEGIKPEKKKKDKQDQNR